MLRSHSLTQPALAFVGSRDSIQRIRRFRLNASRSRLRTTRQEIAMPLRRSLILVLAGLAACKTVDWKTYTQGFVGKPVAHMTAALGQPVMAIPGGDGGQVLTFLQDTRDERFSGRYNCQTTAQVDAGGIVRQVSYTGQGCPV